MKHQRAKLTILAALLVSACGAGQWADQVQVAKLPADEQKAALAVRVFD